MTLPSPAEYHRWPLPVFMFKSIKSILYLSFIVVGVSLSLVIYLGIRHYQLNRQYSEITTLSEGTLFSFVTIREQITESLISGDYQPLRGVNEEIEQLNNTISRLYDSNVIPDQYKLAMADKIDLTGLAIAVRKLSLDEADTKTRLQLQQELRHLAENLYKIDRVILRQIRDSVISFQLSIIGAMGILISCTSFLLIILYRKAIRPLFELTSQVETGEIEAKINLQAAAEAGSEITTLVERFNQLLAEAGKNNKFGEKGGKDGELLSTIINETTNGLNGMINYAQLLLESEVEIGSAQRQMLQQIIDNGERVASQWQDVSQKFTRLG